MATGMDLPMDVDQNIIFPVYVVALAAMTGASAGWLGYTMADPALGTSYSWATVTSAGASVLAGLSYGWLEGWQSDEYDQDQLATIGIAVGLPLAFELSTTVSDFVMSSNMTKVGFVAVGAISLYFATVKMEEDTPVVSSALGQSGD